MRGFEEIQKIVKNFVEESKQAKQQIIEIENERNNLAQERNEKKEGLQCLMLKICMAP